MRRCDDDSRDPGCAPDERGHRWTYEGMGGCTDNPGVWATGGTTIVTKQRCLLCGCEVTHVYYGSQRNLGERDHARYESDVHEVDADAVRHSRALRKRRAAYRARRLASAAKGGV